MNGSNDRSFAADSLDTAPFPSFLIQMHDALNKTGHSIFFSMCEWGVEDPATWAPSVGNSWRTTGDINPSWKSWTGILNANDKWWKHAGPGGWNDPDMLEVDNGHGKDKMTTEEYKAHFTMWCLIKAPLLLGMDLRNITQTGLEIITNKELIAWNQDKLGVQGHMVFQKAVEEIELTTMESSRDASSPWLRKRQLRNDFVEEGGDGDGFIEVWAGPLEDGKYAVVLFNRAKNAYPITARWEDIGIPTAHAMKVRDVWQHEDIGTFAGNYSDLVQPHSVVALEFEPSFLL